MVKVQHIRLVNHFRNGIGEDYGNRLQHWSKVAMSSDNRKWIRLREFKPDTERTYGYLTKPWGPRGNFLGHFLETSLTTWSVKCSIRYRSVNSARSWVCQYRSISASPAKNGIFDCVCTGRCVDRNSICALFASVSLHISYLCLRKRSEAEDQFTWCRLRVTPQHEAPAISQRAYTIHIIFIWNYINRGLLVPKYPCFTLIFHDVEVLIPSSMPKRFISTNTILPFLPGRCLHRPCIWRKSSGHLPPVLHTLTQMDAEYGCRT